MRYLRKRRSDSGGMRLIPLGCYRRRTAATMFALGWSFAASPTQAPLRRCKWEGRTTEAAPPLTRQDVRPVRYRQSRGQGAGGRG